MSHRCDVAIIGAGIVGLAHAWIAARRGLHVVILERSPAASGASVRNFGMIWPIGQPNGELMDAALRAREYWMELDRCGVLTAEPCGSIHLAHHADELQVLEEFAAATSACVQMLTASEVLERSDLANPDGLLGGMFSSTELRVDPRTASARIAAWLQETLTVECHFETLITHVQGRCVQASDGRAWNADRVVICSNDDLRTLFPEVLSRSGLRLCKLQMLRTVAQPRRSPAVPHIASGLTLRHYASFAGCPTLPALQARIRKQAPELDHYGIHVMASQFPDGEVVLGDSHEYDDAITPFDKAEIDELMLRELRRVIRLPDWSIRERWHGIYAKHPERVVFESAVSDSVHIAAGTGGAGMTLAFGLADRAWKRWLGDN